MRLGFAKVDITPRVGVELCGFGPFLNRHSLGVRDRLWARGMAMEVEGRRAVLLSCDLVGVGREITARVRGLLEDSVGLAAEEVMIHCTHTHSGPATRRSLIGWGQPDPPYLEVLPYRLAEAARQALERLEPATLSHAEAPCEGLGLNREYDRDAPPLEEVLREDWRPAHPELTDITCHVLRAEAGGRVLGFAAYFGCHPVVCCQETRFIHGDYAGVAMNLLEHEHPGSVGLFLQGAQGDVNSCVVHKPEAEALPALDVIAARFARQVRVGLAEARPLEVESLACRRREVVFSRLPWGREELQARLAEQEARFAAPGASDEDREVRMAAVYAEALRGLLRRREAGETLEPAAELQGLRLGPLALLASPLEIFQAIKREVQEGARAPLALVLGLTNDLLGYAPDRTAAARGGYAAQMVPLMLGSLPFSDLHSELVEALLALDADLEEQVNLTPEVRA